MNNQAQGETILGMKSTWSLVTNGVPQGSIVQFSIFINDLTDGVECTLNNSAEDTKMGGVAYTSEGCSATQRDLDRLEKWLT